MGVPVILLGNDRNGELSSYTSGVITALAFSVAAGNAIKVQFLFLPVRIK